VICNSVHAQCAVSRSPHGERPCTRLRTVGQYRRSRLVYRKSESQTIPLPNNSPPVFFSTRIIPLPYSFPPGQCPCKSLKREFAYLRFMYCISCYCRGFCTKWDWNNNMYKPSHRVQRMPVFYSSSPVWGKQHRPTVSAAALEPRRQSGRTSGHLRHAQGPDVLRAAQTRERQPDRSFLEH